ncbi:hypothetical protein [Streptomyces californicus]|uniref:hypothetical protein n=1 Tax=Streptomyces californicus TaxID=67351 RepID=UPI0034009A41
MAQRIDNEPWERWPDEVLTEVNAASWALGISSGYEASGDYSNRPWDEWKKPGQSWVAKQGEDFADAFDFATEVWREGTISLGVDVIVWSPEVVFFRFVDCTDRVAEREAVEWACRGTRALSLDPIRAYEGDYLDNITMGDSAEALRAR